MHIEQQIKIDTTPEKIFSIYKDVKGWSRWDIGLDYSSIDGEFKKGAKGEIKPKKAPNPIEFIIEEVEENKHFTTFSDSILCSFKYDFTLESREDNQTVAKHQIWIEVKKPYRYIFPIAFIFANKFIGKSMENDLPKALKNLKLLAER